MTYNKENNFKDIFKNSSKIQNILNNLKKIQKQIIENYQNSVITDKNQLLKEYNELEKLGQSIYRYNALKENNLHKEAESEIENISNILLKGGNSSIKYIWHSEIGACDECKNLDGTIYNSENDIPKRPHPNCKCSLKVIEKEADVEKQQEEKENKTFYKELLKPSSVSQKTPKKQNKFQQNSKWIMPCNGAITSPYGWRIHPTYGTKKFHDGIDIGVPINTIVRTVSDGKVVMARWYNGYGKYIEIDHGNNLHSFYGHLSSYDVKVGDYVKSGQPIARSGNTAGIGKNGKTMTTGPHLHFGIHKNGQPLNPLDFVRNF